MRSRILLLVAAIAFTGCGRQGAAGVIVLQVDGVNADSIGGDPGPCKRYVIKLLSSQMSAAEIQRAFTAAKICGP